MTEAEELLIELGIANDDIGDRPELIRLGALGVLTKKQVDDFHLEYVIEKLPRIIKTDTDIFSLCIEAFLDGWFMQYRNVRKDAIRKTLAYSYGADFELCAIELLEKIYPFLQNGM